MSNYAAKSQKTYKTQTGVDISDFAEKADLTGLKSDID